MGESRKIYITGLGAVSAAGFGVDALWRQVCDQTSATTTVFHSRSVHRNPIPVPIGRVPWEAQPIDGVIDSKTARTTDRAYLIGRIALAEAMRDAGLADHQWKDPGRVAIVVGSELAGITSLEAHTSYLRAADYPRVMRPQLACMTNSGLAGYYAEAVGALGPSLVVSAACASSGYALGVAQLLLMTDQVDCVLVGGVEAPITDTIITTMLGLGALDPEGAADPAGACRPFDATRTGTVMAEGAGFLVLEAESPHVSGDPKAVFAGFGCSSDAHHRTAPHPGGRGTIGALTNALKSAEIDRVDHVNAHATATVLNDKIESHALATVLPTDVRVSATKGAIGHSLAASSALENVVAVRSITDQVIPGITNLSTIGADISAIRLQRHTEPHTVRTAANIAIGFAGYNTAALFAAA
jgi:3-oxoacyl-[acyl-carrier-protein] synthase II